MSFDSSWRRIATRRFNRLVPVVALVLALVGCGENPTPTSSIATPARSGNASAAPSVNAVSPSPSTVVPEAIGDWIRRIDPSFIDPLGQTTIDSMAVGPGGLIAVGSSSSGPAMWHSGDAVHWERVRNGPMAIAIVADDQAYFAVGSRLQTSPDGRHWSTLPWPGGRPIEGLGITVTPTALYAVGGIENAEGRVSHEWVSRDRGRSWVELHPDLDMEQVSAIAELPDGRLIAVGVADDTGFSGYSGEPLRGGWVSEDGKTWADLGKEFLPAPTDLPQEERASGWTDVAVGEDGRIVVVGGDNGHAMALTSSDGTSWARVALPPGTAADASPGSEPRFVTATSRGYVAAGGVNASSGIWRSLDGLEWELEPDLDAFAAGGPGPVEVWSVTEFAGRIVLGGTYPRPEAAGGHVSAATWVSPSQGVGAFEEPTACPRKADLVSIANVPASRRARCFGGRSITITGYLAEGYDCECPIRSLLVSPRRGPYYFQFDVYPLTARGADIARWAKIAGHRVRITGRISDPSSKRCTAKDVEPPADPVATCRSRFVAYTIQDLGKAAG
jgi:hypothetical protein